MILSEIIIKRISEEGPISFHDFMEMALYYPCTGYYQSPSQKIGTKGDYYTSPYMTDIFGALIAKQLEEMWVIMGKGSFTIVEFGAGTGLLCADIIRQLKLNKEFYEEVEYVIIEKSASMRSIQKSSLDEKVKWCENIREVSPLRGCILANELVDNFSIHLVEMQKEAMEILVNYKNGFIEEHRPLNDKLKNYLKQFDIKLNTGDRVEINLEAIVWMQSQAEALDKGFIITIDYGSMANDLYNGFQKTGSLQCYYQHTKNNNPYENIGQQDITAHVNFSALLEAGTGAGLHYTGFIRQASFLQGLGLSAHLKEIETSLKDKGTSEDQKLLFVRSFLMEMGKNIKVLIQHKEIDKPVLSGLQFSD